MVSGAWISSQKEEVFRESNTGKFDSVLFSPPQAFVSRCLKEDGFFDFVFEFKDTSTAKFTVKLTNVIGNL